MRSGYLALFLLAVSGTASPADLACPPGAVSGSLDGTGGLEAWCRLEADPDIFHGPYLAWHPNGVLGVRENFVRGEANGKAAYRWPSGSRQAEGGYKAGVRDGRWIFWDKNGVKAGEVRYRKGELVSGQLPKWALDWDVKPVARQPPVQP